MQPFLHKILHEKLAPASLWHTMRKWSSTSQTDGGAILRAWRRKGGQGEGDAEGPFLGHCGSVLVSFLTSCQLDRTQTHLSRVSIEEVSRSWWAVSVYAGESDDCSAILTECGWWHQFMGSALDCIKGKKDGQALAASLSSKRVFCLCF